MPARAQDSKGLPVIRDAEIEQLLRDYTQPILRAAGLAKQNIQVVIINDRSFNAFVMDGRRIFVNSGALHAGKTPNEIIGVLAHETGHMAGGHLAKLREQLAQAQTQMIIAMLLGVGAMVAGAAAARQSARQRRRPRCSAPQEIIQPLAALLSAPQEEQADRAGVKFLTATGQSPRACTTPSSASPTRSCSPRAASIPICSRIRCRPSASPRWRNSPSPVPIGTRRTCRRCSCATT